MLPFRNRALDRRMFLRGAGACVAVPLLDAMVPAIARAPFVPPLRALFVFAPNGQKMDEWRPAAIGPRWELPYLLAPLEPVRRRVTVITGLAIDGGRPHQDGAGDHARAAASFLTCAHPKKTGGSDLRAGVSIDQRLAAAVGAATRFPSLELGLEPGAAAGICDSGYSCAYSNNISWRTESAPVAKATEPRAVFARLFGDPEAAQDAAARARERTGDRSVLDAVLADSKSLQGTLGAADRRKLDDYLAAVRELEQRLARDDGVAAPPVPAGLLDRMQDSGADYPQRLDLMYELLALAFAADLVRIATLMLGNAGSNRSYRFLGVPDGHHDLSHHGKKPEKLAGVRAINRFHMERFASFLQRLAGTREGDRDLLQQSAIVYGSGIGDGDQHNHDDLPVVLCGGGGGAIAGGHHSVCARETPMANLYLALLSAFGVEASSFADSTGSLPLQ
jgi:hypothetical protein